MNRSDGELRRIAAHTDAHPRFVALQIIHAVRHRLAFARIRKVVRIDLARLTFAAPRLPRILKISQVFLLFGIDRDGRLIAPLLHLHARVDVPELCVSVRMRLAFPRLAIGLQTVARLLQQVPHGCRSYCISLCCERLGQLPCALASPLQRRHGVAATLRFYQTLQCRDQIGHLRFRTLAAPSLAPLTSHRSRIAAPQFLDAAPNRALCQARRLADGRNPASSQRHRLHSRPPPSPTLRQITRQPLILARNPLHNAPVHDGPIDRQSSTSSQSQFKHLFTRGYLGSGTERCVGSSPSSRTEWSFRGVSYDSLGHRRSPN